MPAHDYNQLTHVRHELYINDLGGHVTTSD